MKVSDMIHYIEKSCRLFTTIKCLVLTGGEVSCFKNIDICNIGDIMTLDLEKISDDEESNLLIDKTISESLQGENEDKISLVQNIAKSAYYEYK